MLVLAALITSALSSSFRLEQYRFSNGNGAPNCANITGPDSTFEVVEQTWTGVESECVGDKKWTCVKDAGDNEFIREMVYNENANGVCPNSWVEEVRYYKLDVCSYPTSSIRARILKSMTCDDYETLSGHVMMYTKRAVSGCGNDWEDASGYSARNVYMYPNDCAMSISYTCSQTDRSLTSHSRRQTDDQTTRLCDAATSEDTTWTQMETGCEHVSYSSGTRLQVLECGGVIYGSDSNNGGNNDDGSDSNGDGSDAAQLSVSIILLMVLTTVIR